LLLLSSGRIVDAGQPTLAVFRIVRQIAFFMRIAFQIEQFFVFEFEGKSPRAPGKALPLG
jgi:hypothetical protein